MTRLRVQFDGKVLVPVGPVDLPTGRVLDIDVHDEQEPPRGSPQAVLKALLSVPPVEASIVDEWERAIRAGESRGEDEDVFG